MSGDKSILLPLTYLGPVHLYSRYYRSETVLIEQNDTYQKQSYRNRCDIYGANGKLSLIVPVKHFRGIRQKVKDVKIDYETDWRRLHSKGIESAYNSSPYFEFYRDTFEPYYKKSFVFLLDLCVRMNDDILNVLGITQKSVLSKEFLFPSDNPGVSDLRQLIHPKKSIELNTDFRIFEYQQVFSQTHGFIPGLSILDLIFNMGPESGKMLRGASKE